MSGTKTLHKFEINVGDFDSDFFIKMDGEEIRGVRDVTITIPLVGRPRVMIEILASKISGKIAAEFDALLAPDGEPRLINGKPVVFYEGVDDVATKLAAALDAQDNKEKKP
jgi:hypothetical protein